jgi:nitroreductase
VGVLRETTACAGDATPSALVTRRSIRKYLDTPVSDDLVQQVLVEARWAPSCSNSQSTLVYVLSGKPFEDFKAELRKLSLVNVPAESDVPIGGPWTPAQEVRTQVFKEFRSVWCAAEEQRLGIEPEPAPARSAAAAGFGLRQGRLRQHRLLRLRPLRHGNNSGRPAARTGHLHRGQSHPLLRPDAQVHPRPAGQEGGHGHSHGLSGCGRDNQPLPAVTHDPRGLHSLCEVGPAARYGALMVVVAPTTVVDVSSTVVVVLPDSNAFRAWSRHRTSPAMSM